MIVAEAPKRARRRPPPDVAAYRVDGEDDLVLFVWEARPPAESRGGRALSAAEHEVLDLVVEGKSNAEIARARGTSVRTVANQVARMLKKLGAGSRFELIGRIAPKRRAQNA